MQPFRWWVDSDKVNPITRLKGSNRFEEFYAERKNPDGVGRPWC